MKQLNAILTFLFNNLLNNVIKVSVIINGINRINNPSLF